MNALREVFGRPRLLAVLAVLWLLDVTAGAAILWFGVPWALER